MNRNLQQLRATGQSLWLDNITRTLLDSGTLSQWIDEYGLTGLTSNPTIFEKAVSGSDAYDDVIDAKWQAGMEPEPLFIEMALADLCRAAELFAPVHRATGGIDGWVSMEVSPLLAADTAGTIAAAQRIHAQAGCDNLYVKIPGTPAGVPAIEESIYNGVPVNVTLLFSAGQYQAAAEAYLRGIERRIADDRGPVVSCVASVFVSRWDRAIAKDGAPAELHNRLGIAVSQVAYSAYRELLDSPRWRKLAAAGAQPQRLLWASTSTKDPQAPDTLYLSALAAPDTINTIPDKTLKAFADHGKVDSVLGQDATGILRPFTDAGIDVDALAARLQREGAHAFVESWKTLMQCIADEAKSLA